MKAVKIMESWNKWLFDRGHQQRAPDKHDMTHDYTFGQDAATEALRRARDRAIASTSSTTAATWNRIAVLSSEADRCHQVAASDGSRKPSVRAMYSHGYLGFRNSPSALESGLGNDSLFVFFRSILARSAAEASLRRASRLRNLPTSSSILLSLHRLRRR
jgi:hypothetical protein